MMRYTGVVSRGIIAPIFRQGDDLISITVKSILQASEAEGFSIQDRDIIGVKEALVARTQGNFATIEQIAADIREKLGGRDMGIIFPILSRNRFSNLLKAFSMACDRLYVQFSYPTDEMGNGIVSIDDLDEQGIDPYTDSFDERGFRAIFKDRTVHRFTGVDYVKLYKSLGNNIDVIFSNNPKYILHYTKNVVNCDIHTRHRTNKILKKNGAERAFRLDQLMTAPVDGSGYNEIYGLLGSNKADEQRVKLYPRYCQNFVLKLQQAMLEATGKHVEVMIYGDGGFKDPVGGIWGLADPVVSPAYTDGLKGTSKEFKMKYLLTSELKGLSGEELSKAMKEKIREKSDCSLCDTKASGTAPRQHTDIVGSLCDLTGGIGDRGTPIILVQNYFNNYATE
ncbi:MAG: F420-0--gamma-glutamyl ligase [Papillibacter sp.]|nr:F420-0--gamma-glutamyl ligase [Papillibacter sp.]